MDYSFTGKVAVVTGAAHGIGRSICVELSKLGAHVYATDCLTSELKDTVGQCHESGGACNGYAMDVTDEASVHKVTSEVLQREPGIDILVNVAGGVLGQVGKPLEDVNKSEWNEIVAVNLTGTFTCCQAVAPSMKEHRYGRIVNISSGAGRSTSLTGIQAYASAKAGQIGLTRQLAQELGPWGITVNTIAPGFILSNTATQRQWESYGAVGQAKLLAELALRRLGEPKDIANGVLFFASDAASWCTGQVLSIDGGKALF